MDRCCSAWWRRSGCSFIVQAGVEVVLELTDGQQASQSPNHALISRLFGDKYTWVVLMLLRHAYDAGRRFASILASALFLNFWYMILVEMVYKESSFGYVMRENFDGFVWDVFGACAQGYAWNDCVPL